MTTPRLYRFYNCELSKHGEPFGLCDEHYQLQPIPAGCYLELLADKSKKPCEFCEEAGQGRGE